MISRGSKVLLVYTRSFDWREQNEMLSAQDLDVDVFIIVLMESCD
jgi:hypothetical protein